MFANVLVEGAFIILPLNRKLGRNCDHRRLVPKLGTVKMKPQVLTKRVFHFSWAAQLRSPWNTLFVTSCTQPTK